MFLDSCELNHNLASRHFCNVVKFQCLFSNPFLIFYLLVFTPTFVWGGLASRFGKALFLLVSHLRKMIALLEQWTLDVSCPPSGDGPVNRHILTNYRCPLFVH